MKRLFGICLCVLLLLCSFAPAAFADDIWHNTLNDQQNFTDTVNFVEYTVGYTIASNCKNDWNLEQMETGEDGEYYTATVTAGSTLSFQLNCPGGGKNVNLGIMLAAADEGGNQIGGVEIGNSEDRSDAISGDYLIPDDAKVVEIIMLAIPHDLNLDDVGMAGVGMVLNVEGKEKISGGISGGLLGNDNEDEGTDKPLDDTKDDQSDLEWVTDDKSDDVDSLGDAFTELGKAAVKTIIAVGATGIGLIAVIIAIVKGRGAKKAAATGVKAAAKGVRAAGKAASEEPKAVKPAAVNGGGVEDSYVVTDPATGAQTLYVKDAEGNWVSSDGSSVLDTGKLPEWQQQRTADRAWQDQSNEGLKKPTTFENIDQQAALEEEKIARESYIEQVAVKHGVYGEDIDTIYEKVSHDQGVADVFAQSHMESAEHISTVIEVTENIKTTADYSVSALGAVTGPAGTVVKDLYAAGTTVGGDVAEAVAAGKDGWDIAQAASGAVAKSAVSVIQNHATGVAGKAAADILGGAATGGTDALVKGENVGQGIAKGAASGTMSAMADTGGEMVGALKDGSDLGSLGKDLVSSASDLTGDLVKNTASDAINESFDKTFKELNKTQK